LTSQFGCPPGTVVDRQAPQVTGGIPIYAPTDNGAPPRSVRDRLLLTPWGNRPRACAGVRFAVGIWLVFLGGLLLSDGYLWATLLLVAAALLFWVGYLNMATARSAPPQT
jgi:hypothetical protein